MLNVDRNMKSLCSTLSLQPVSYDAMLRRMNARFFGAMCEKGPSDPKDFHVTSLRAVSEGSRLSEETNIRAVAADAAIVGSDSRTLPHTDRARGNTTTLNPDNEMTDVENELILPSSSSSGISALALASRGALASASASRVDHGGDESEWELVPSSTDGEEPYLDVFFLHAVSPRSSPPARPARIRSSRRSRSRSVPPSPECN